MLNTVSRSTTLFASTIAALLLTTALVAPANADPFKKSSIGHFANVAKPGNVHRRAGMTMRPVFRIRKVNKYLKFKDTKSSTRPTHAIKPHSFLGSLKPSHSHPSHLKKRSKLQRLLANKHPIKPGSAIKPNTSWTTKPLAAKVSGAPSRKLPGYIMRQLGKSGGTGAFANRPLAQKFPRLRQIKPMGIKPAKDGMPSSVSNGSAKLPGYVTGKLLGSGKLGSKSEAFRNTLTSKLIDLGKLNTSGNSNTGGSRASGDLPSSVPNKTGAANDTATSAFSNLLRNNPQLMGRFLDLGKQDGDGRLPNAPGRFDPNTSAATGTTFGPNTQGATPSLNVPGAHRWQPSGTNSYVTPDKAFFDPNIIGRLGNGASSGQGGIKPGSIGIGGGGVSAGIAAGGPSPSGPRGGSQAGSSAMLGAGPHATISVRDIGFGRREISLAGLNGQTSTARVDGSGNISQGTGEFSQANGGRAIINPNLNNHALAVTITSANGKHSTSVLGTPNGHGAHDVNAVVTRDSEGGTTVIQTSTVDGEIYVIQTVTTGPDGATQTTLEVQPRDQQTGESSGTPTSSPSGGQAGGSSEGQSGGSDGQSNDQNQNSSNDDNSNNSSDDQEEANESDSSDDDTATTTSEGETADTTDDDQQASSGGSGGGYNPNQTCGVDEATGDYRCRPMTGTEITQRNQQQQRLLRAILGRELTGQPNPSEAGAGTYSGTGVEPHRGPLDDPNAPDCRMRDCNSVGATDTGLRGAGTSPLEDAARIIDATVNPGDR